MNDRHYYYIFHKNFSFLLIKLFISTNIKYTKTDQEKYKKSN